MYVPFENLPEDSKIWIYQSNRKFSDDEMTDIENDLKFFIENWSAHGTGLEASYLSSVAFIQKLEQRYQVDLLDKMNVTFKNGEHIAHKSLIDFKRMAKEKAVTANTIVFNNLVNSIEEFNENWEVPAGESWHSRFF
jgi:hypothetical protein